MAGSVVLPSLEEISALGDAELEACLVELEHARRVVEAAMVDVVDVADRRRVWATDGHRGVRNWLIALTDVSPAEASRRCQLMRAMRDLDELRDALRSGEIGVCQARELARVHANPRVRARMRRAETRLVTAARRRCFDDFHRATVRWTAAADRFGAELSHDDTHAARHARLRVTPTGVTLTAHGGTAQGSQMLEIFAAYVDAEFRTEWEAGRERHGDAMCAELLERSSRQREFDALHAIFLAAARRPANHAEPAVSVPTVNIVIDEATFTDYLAHTAGGPAPAAADSDSGVERRCETDRGHPIDPRAAVIAALLGRVRRVVYDSAGVVIDLGRTQRLFRGSTRQAVWLQGRHCLWPGCGITAHHQDHTHEWAAHHGTTTPANAGPTCQRHNHWKQHGYRTWRHTDGTWHVTRPDGTPLDQPRAA
jgi:hypothetical protein